MPNRSREKGYRWERKVRDYFRSQGCFVVRQGASLFPDLIVLRPKGDSPWLIECKVNKYLSRDEKEEAKRLVAYGDFFVASPERRGRRVVVKVSEPTKEA